MLTPEEEKELAELERLAKQDAASEMTDEETAELDSLEAMVGQVDETHPVAAMARGAIEAIPFAKDAVAAVETASSVIQGETDLSIDAISEEFTSQQKHENELIEQAEEDSPIAFNVGDFGTGFALGGAGIARNVALSAASAVSRSEERTLNDALAGGTIGLVFDRLGAGFGKLIKKGVNKLGNKAAASTGEALGASNAKLKLLNQHLSKTNQTVEDFSASILRQKTADGFPILNAGQDFAESLAHVKSAREVVGSKIGRIYSKIDKEAKISIQSKDVRNKITNDIIEPLLASDNPDFNSVGAKLQNFIKEATTESTEKITRSSDGVETIVREIKDAAPWNLARIHAFKSDMAKTVGREFKKVGSDINLAAEKKAIVGNLGGFIDEIVGGNAQKIAETSDDITLNALQRAKKDFSNIAIADELLEKAAKESSNNGIVSTLKEALSLKGLVVGGALSSFGAPPLVATAVGIGINRVMNSPTFPATMAVGANRLSSFLNAGGPKAEKIARKLTVAAGLSQEHFTKKLASAIAEVDLTTRPVERSSAAVAERSSSIAAILRDENPRLADQFEALVEEGNQDAINQFMSEIEDMPAASQFIKPGQGFDGKLYSQTDKDNASSDVGVQRNLPRLQRLKLQQRIQAEGYIPQPEDLEDPRKPRPFIPRDRSKSEF